MVKSGGNASLGSVESVELVSRAKSGETECAEELFRRYRSRLLRIAKRSLGSNQLGCDPSDLVQSTLRRAALDWDQFEPQHERAIGAWFSTIMLNTIRTLRRREFTIKRGGGLEPQWLDETEGVSPARGSADSMLEGLAEDELATRVWSSLTPAEHKLVQLRLTEGLPWEEVAQRTGASDGESARRRYGALLARLRGKLSREDS